MTKRIIALILSAACIFSTAYYTVETANATALTAEQRQKLENDKKAAEEKRDDLKDEKSDVLEEIAAIDNKMNAISSQMLGLEEDIESTETSIEENKAKLAEAQAAKDDQYEYLKTRIRYMYENSGISLLEVICEAKSFHEMLNQAQYFIEINNYDRKKLAEYQEIIDTIENTTKALEEEASSLETMKGDLEVSQSEMDAVMAEKEGVLREINGDIGDLEEKIEEFEASIEADNEILAAVRAAKTETVTVTETITTVDPEDQKRYDQEKAEYDQKVAEQEAEYQRQKEEAEKQAAESGSAEAEVPEVKKPEPIPEPEPPKSTTETVTKEVPSSFTSGMVWPVPSSSRVTSEFGPRVSPTAGASSNHKGIDIGASSGSAIVATAAGTVITASYSSTSGNWIAISHGGGLVTIYCHCSALYVSAGQKVSQGQKIAAVGSTGVSTGPHLHFGVTLNGNYVNPRNYI